jgi:hypothetical protein
MRGNSKPHEDLVYEVNHGGSQDSFRSLITGIADRLEACHLNPVKTSDLITILREDTTKLYNTVMRKS